jgi:hypothetical protein
MHTLEAPTVSVSEVKQSPTRIFSLAASSNNGVYVFNHSKVAGVMLTEQQYSGLLAQLDELEDLLVQRDASRRIQITQPNFTDEEVRGAIAAEAPAIDSNDGWE